MISTLTAQPSPAILLPGSSGTFCPDRSHSRAGGIISFRFINDIEARSAFVEENHTKTEANLYFSESRLTIKVTSTQFQAGEMRIKCVASLTDEPIEADQSSDRDGIVLEVIKLPEAMKLQTENIFDGEYPCIRGCQ